MAMRIVVEPSSFHCLNMGDVAMMQVAVARLNELWPHAEIDVVSSRPDLLSRYCPSATPISTEARSAWLSGRSLIGGLHRKFPAGISAQLKKVERLLWLRYSPVTELGGRLKAATLRREFPSVSGFRRQLTGANLLVVSGAGMLNDAFADLACPLLDELEFALQAGVPVVAFGLGVGPITGPALLAKARAVFPHLKLIGLREGHNGLPLLHSLGVPSDRIQVTGDDAIELAFKRRHSPLGNAIGINLRLAGYAGTGEDTAAKLRQPLLDAVQALKSSLVPVPISFSDESSDEKAIGRLLDSQSHAPQTKIECPEDVIDLIGNCRVVVTGSYHAGVFALSQGIPVVGLLESTYYEQKFIGLQKQFPDGCRMIDFRQPVTPCEIQETICNAWKSAEEVRESLLRAAALQVELGRAAYQTLLKLITLKS